MSVKHACLSLAAAILLSGFAAAKGPGDSKKYSKYPDGKGYSGKGVPSSSSPSKSSYHASKYPSLTFPTPSRPTTTKGSSAGSAAGSYSKYSKYSKERPRYPFVRPQTSTPSKDKPAGSSPPVQLPQRPAYSPPTNTSRPTASTRPVKTKPAYQLPPAVILPKPTGPPKKSPTTTRPARPTTNPTSMPSRLPTSTSRPTSTAYSIYRNRPSYGGLRPPSGGRPSSPTATTVYRPTIANQSNTNITNNVNNIHNWYQGNSWKKNVTINSQHWNGRPWWYEPDYRDWHHGHWHGSYYFRGRDAWKYVDTGETPWLNGLVAWGLGNLVYRSGYQVYANPYYSQPLVIGSTTINYSRPICVQRSQYEILYASDEMKARQLRLQALAYFEAARRAFYAGDVSDAYDGVNRAIALMPDDTALHEFRALVLFSAGRYREAAEVMHAVLAVAPGWDWTTLSGLYREQDTYIQQLRKLEDYVRLNPRSADARFLLAYHCITMGYPDNAEQQLRAVLILKPDDRLAADLIELMHEDKQPQTQVFPGMEATVRPGALEGKWVGRRPKGDISLEIRDGNFRWDYAVSDTHQLLSGKYELTGNRLALATQDGSQMVGTVDRNEENRFTFRLLGSSDSDPGVVFVRRP